MSVSPVHHTCAVQPNHAMRCALLQKCDKKKEKNNNKGSRKKIKKTSLRWHPYGSSQATPRGGVESDFVAHTKNIVLRFVRTSWHASKAKFTKSEALRMILLRQTKHCQDQVFFSKRAMLFGCFFFDRQNTVGTRFSLKQCSLQFLKRRQSTVGTSDFQPLYCPPKLPG